MSLLISRTDGRYSRQPQAANARRGKKEKSGILDEFAETKGYHRRYATAVLNGRRERVHNPVRQASRVRYGAEEAGATAILADLFDNICPKRLRAAMDVKLP